MTTVDVRWLHDQFGGVFLNADDLCVLIREAIREAKSNQAKQAAGAIADTIDDLRRKAQDESRNLEREGET